MRIAILLVAALPALAAATDVSVIGLFPGKALVTINGGQPRTLSVDGPTLEGVKLIASGDGAATLEFDGKRRSIAMGQHVASGKPSSGPASVNLAADGRGHFFTQGQINGVTVMLVVDTGASSVLMSADTARRLGINYKSGQAALAQTANGTTPAWRVNLETVRVGDIVMYQIEGAVVESPLDVVLLGNSFLNRTDMRRDGALMTLTKRF